MIKFVCDRCQEEDQILDLKMLTSIRRKLGRVELCLKCSRLFDENFMKPEVNQRHVDDAAWVAGVEPIKQFFPGVMDLLPEERAMFPQKVKAIVAVRKRLGLDLRTAKALVERLGPCEKSSWCGCISCLVIRRNDPCKPELVRTPIAHRVDDPSCPCDACLSSRHGFKLT